MGLHNRPSSVRLVVVRKAMCGAIFLGSGTHPYRKTVQPSSSEHLCARLSGEKSGRSMTGDDDTR